MKTTTIICILASALLAVGAPPLVRIAWDDPGPEETALISSYIGHIGVESGVYTKEIPIGKPDGFKSTVEDLEVGKTYFLALTAVGKNGLESGYSNEISFTISPTPQAPTGLRIDVTVTVTISP